MLPSKACSCRAVVLVVQAASPVPWAWGWEGAIRVGTTGVVVAAEGFTSSSKVQGLGAMVHMGMGMGMGMVKDSTTLTPSSMPIRIMGALARALVSAQEVQGLTIAKVVHSTCRCPWVWAWAWWWEGWRHSLLDLS